MGIRNTPDQNRRASAKRRDHLRAAGYRVLHTEIPGPLHARLLAVAHARKLTVAAAVAEALDEWANNNEEQQRGTEP